MTRIVLKGGLDNGHLGCTLPTPLRECSYITLKRVQMLFHPSLPVCLVRLRINGAIKGDTYIAHLSRQHSPCLTAIAALEEHRTPAYAMSGSTGGCPRLWLHTWGCKDDRHRIQLRPRVGHITQVDVSMHLPEHDERTGELAIYPSFIHCLKGVLRDTTSGEILKIQQASSTGNSNVRDASILLPGNKCKLLVPTGEEYSVSVAYTTSTGVYVHGENDLQIIPQGSVLEIPPLNGIMEVNDSAITHPQVLVELDVK